MPYIGRNTGSGQSNWLSRIANARQAWQTAQANFITRRYEYDAHRFQYRLGNDTLRAQWQVAKAAAKAAMDNYYSVLNQAFEATARKK